MVNHVRLFIIVAIYELRVVVYVVRVITLCGQAVCTASVDSPVFADVSALDQ